MQDFERVFLMLKYTDITQNTYIQSLTVTEIMAREKRGCLRFQILQPAQLIRHVTVLMSLREECSVHCACVTVSCLHGIARMPFVFSHVEYCDMHFVYGFCNGNARAAVDEYQRRFPDRRIPSRGVFTRINQTLRDTACLPSVAVRSEKEVVRKINTRENILQMVQRSPRLSTRRMACCIGVSRMQVWRNVHEEDLYHYHDQRVQHLEPCDHAQRMELCRWITAHPELLSVILLTDEASFTRDGINNSRNVRTWSHENPRETRVTNCQTA